VNAHETILSGDFGGDDEVTGSGSTLSIANNTENAIHVVLGINVTNTTILDGFSIRGGNASAFGSFSTGGTTVGQDYGGGISNFSSSPVLININIWGNNASTGGGGIYNNWPSSPVLTNVTLSRNSAGGNGGGGIHNSSSSPVLTNVIISGNKSTDGGGIHNTSSSPILTNVIISENSGTIAGGIGNRLSSSPVLTNVTIAGNYATTSGGINYSDASGIPKIRNSIIWGNSSGIAYSATPQISSSVIQGESGFPTTIPDPSTGNLNRDPQFVSSVPAISATPTTPGNYSLQGGSPAINTGDDALYPPTNWMTWSTTAPFSSSLLTEADYEAYVKDALQTDLAGNPRLNGSIDMGAYEK
jgi:hypothetical protein